MAAKTTTKTKKSAVEHTLKAKYVKDRSRWEGACTCGRRDGFGTSTEENLVANFEIHARACGVRFDS